LNKKQEGEIALITLGIAFMAVIVGLGGLGWSGSWILVAIALLVGLVGVDIRTGTTGLSGHQDRNNWSEWTSGQESTASS